MLKFLIHQEMQYFVTKTMSKSIQATWKRKTVGIYMYMMELLVLFSSGEGEKGRRGTSEDRVSTEGKPAAQPNTRSWKFHFQDQEKVCVCERERERERESEKERERGGREGEKCKFCPS